MVRSFYDMVWPDVRFTRELPRGAKMRAEDRSTGEEVVLRGIGPKTKKKAAPSPAPTASIPPPPPPFRGKARSVAPPNVDRTGDIPPPTAEEEALIKEAFGLEPDSYPTPLQVAIFRQGLLLDRYFLRMDPLSREEAEAHVQGRYDETLSAHLRAGGSRDDAFARELKFRREASVLTLMGRPLREAKFLLGVKEAAGVIRGAEPSRRPLSADERDRLLDHWRQSQPSWHSVGRELPRPPAELRDAEGTVLRKVRHEGMVLEQTTAFEHEGAIIICVAESNRGSQWFQVTDEALDRLQAVVSGERDRSIATAEGYFNRMGELDDFSSTASWQRIYDLTAHRPEHHLHGLAKRHLEE